MEIRLLFMKGTAGKLYQTSVFVSNKVARFRQVYFARYWLFSGYFDIFFVAVSLTACV